MHACLKPADFTTIAPNAQADLGHHRPENVRQQGPHSQNFLGRS